MKMWLALVGFGLVGCGAAESPNSAIAVAMPAEVDALVDAPMPTGQLPQGASPQHYAIVQRIDPSGESFSGQVEVRVRFDAPHRAFWMHAAKLVIDEATVSRGTTESVAPCTPTVDEAHELVRLECPDLEGDRLIRVRYHAAWSDHLSGLYRVREGQDAYAFTQFEATDARRAFPCFDEPRFKTAFDLVIEAPSSMRAFGNTRELEVTPSERASWTTHRYATTRPLPTYLIAMAVGPFDVVEAPPIEATDARQTPIALRAIALKGKGAKLARALEFTPRLVLALERYAGHPYPYDKLDLVAVPDFSAGAMENPGLITFRESLLLLDETSTLATVRDSVSVTSHELAHQWFGNLVTMPWWDDIWLNEAFATWFGTKIHHELYPTHDADVDLLEFVHWAMRQDSLSAARRVHEPIRSNHDIQSAFDAITYAKGAALLSMFERWLGPAVFQRGVQAYLQAHAFGSATTRDFLAALVQASGNERIEGAFLGFLDQPGVPIVKLSSRSSQAEPSDGARAPAACDASVTSVHLEPSRYLPLGSPADASQHWATPVCLRTSGSAEPTCSLVEGPTDVTIPASTWVMPNADAAGYFRVAFDRCALDALLGRGYSSLTLREKLALGDGIRAAVSSNAMPAEDGLAAVERFLQDPHPSVVTLALGLIATADKEWLTDAERTRMRAWLSRALGRRWRTLGWNVRASESPDDTILRPAIFGALAFTARDVAVRREALTRAKRYLGQDAQAPLDASGLAPELLDGLVALAGEDADESLFNLLEARLRASNDAVVRHRMLVGLASSRDDARLARALALSLDSGLRNNETNIPIAVAMGDRQTRARAWAWLEQHLDPLLTRFSTFRADRLIRVSENFCSTEDADSVDRLFSSRAPSIEGGPRALSLALESIRLCAARMQAQSASARRFFAARR